MMITLRAARVNAGLTQEEVAQRLGLSKNTLSSYEQFQSVPKIDMAQKLADLYRCSVDDIIFLRNDCAKSTEDA